MLNESVSKFGSLNAIVLQRSRRNCLLLLATEVFGKQGTTGQYTITLLGKVFCQWQVLGHLP